MKHGGTAAALRETDETREHLDGRRPTIRGERAQNVASDAMGDPGEAVRRQAVAPGLQRELPSREVLDLPVGIDVDDHDSTAVTGKTDGHSMSGSGSLRR